MTENIFEEGESYSFVVRSPDGQERHHLNREYLGTDGHELAFGSGRVVTAAGVVSDERLLVTLDLIAVGA